MRVRLTKQLRFSPDGNEVVVYPAGLIIDGRAALAALAMKCGVLAEEPAGSAPMNRSATPPKPSNGGPKSPDDDPFEDV